MALEALELAAQAVLLVLALHPEQVIDSLSDLLLMRVANWVAWAAVVVVALAY